DAADTTVMRPTPSGLVMPVVLVQLAPSLLLIQTWPSMVRRVSVVAATLSTKPWPPVHAIDHTIGDVVYPVARLIGVHDTPALIERNTPLSVPASTIFGSVGSTTIDGMRIESPSRTGSDQLSPPLPDTITPMPVPSNGSPRPT